MDIQGFSYDILDSHAGVERGIGILENHLHMAPLLFHLSLREGAEIDPLEENSPSRRLIETEKGAAYGRFPTPTFPHEPQCFSCIDA
jgi:hypothetical protein